MSYQSSSVAPASVADGAGPLLRLDLASRESALGLAAVGEGGIVLEANPAFCRFLGIEYPVPVAGIDLAAHIAATCTGAPVEMTALFERDHPATLVLRPALGVPFVLHAGTGRPSLRLVVAEAASSLPSGWLSTSHASRRDALTGLGNRALLEAIVGNWVPMDPDTDSLAVITVDLDRFKQVNETLGHDAGDILLKLAARRIRSAAGDSDAVMRIGGDEFAIVQTGRGQPECAEEVAGRIVDLLARPFLVQGHQINVGASVGVAIVNHGTDRIDELLKHADLALSAAKAGGRGSYRLFDASLAQRAFERSELELHLRRALVLKEFELLYQPQIDVASGSLRGFEALIRWNNAARGRISPADFIPLAEEIGEIDAIGAWVIDTACRDAMTWRGDYHVAVNVSPIQLQSDEIVRVVHRALARSGLPASRLELEITESVLLQDTEAALQRLWAVKDLGVGIAMDDFGTGYSSLSFLNSFPFSKIKIDQSFVRGEQTPRSQSLVKAILALGASLGMMTIAEGVETREQLAALAQQGCAAAQGYLIGRPIPLAEVDEFVDAGAWRRPEG